MSCMTIFHKKNTYFRKEFLDDTFFTLFVLSRASNNTISQNIGGTDAWAVPTSNLFGWNAPQSPIGLRPWGIPGVNAPEGTCLKRIENSIEHYSFPAKNVSSKLCLGDFRVKSRAVAS